MSLNLVLSALNNMKAHLLLRIKSSLMKTGIIVFLIFVFSLSWAGSVIDFSLPEITTQAEVIVKGKCVGINKNGPFTLVRFLVKEVIKGSKDLREKVLDIKQLGGSIQGYKIYVPGARQFELGEEDILFLIHNYARDTWSILGLSQGAARIWVDPSSEAFVNWKGKDVPVKNFIREIKQCLLSKPGL